MSVTLRVPKAAVSMQEGTLSSWLVADGALVVEGEPIYVLEIDKSTLDVAAPASGRLKQFGTVGSTYPVGEVLGEILTEDVSVPPESG